MRLLYRAGLGSRPADGGHNPQHGIRHGGGFAWRNVDTKAATARPGRAGSAVTTASGTGRTRATKRTPAAAGTRAAKPPRRRTEPGYFLFGRNGGRVTVTGSA